MRIKNFEAFVKAAELQSFTRAAEALDCTQSGISQMIAGLEEEFGFPLFTRGRGGARLTEAGHAVLPEIQAIVAHSEQLNSIVSSIRGLAESTIRVGAFTSVAVHWLPGMIKDFQKNHPNINFKLLNGDYHDVEQWVTDGAVDLGFVNLPNQLSCRCIPLCKDKLLAVLPKNHPLAGLSRLPIQAVENEDFISLLEASDHDARRTLEAAGVTPNIKFITKDDYAIIAMVENGLGISIMPQLLLKDRADNVRIMELDPAAARTIALAVSEEGERLPAAQSFAEHICGWVTRHAEA